MDRDKKIDVQKWFDNIKEKVEEYSGSDTNKKIDMKFKIIVSTSIISSILDYAEKENVDLIVVGTRGRSGIKKTTIRKYSLRTCNSCFMSCYSSKIKKTIQREILISYFKNSFINIKNS